MYAGLKIYHELKNNGIDVYFPDMHEGIVDSSIVVIVDMGQNAEFGSNKCGTTLIHLILHTPKNKYAQMDDLRKQVKNIMKQMTGVRSTGTETPVLPDDNKQSFTTSIEYEVKKKL